MNSRRLHGLECLVYLTCTDSMALQYRPTDYGTLQDRITGEGTISIFNFGHPAGRFILTSKESIYGKR